MAILTHLPGIEVTINVNGRALSEHRERQLIDPPETISRYVEVQSEQHFEVHIRTSPGAVRAAGHKFFVHVDGNKTDWGLVEPRHCISGPKISISAGTHRREGLTRPYKFNVFTTDDDGSKERTKHTTQLGTIEVRIHTVSTVERLPAAPHPAARERTFAPGVPSPHEPLAEKAVKFQELSHTVG
ncbi:hypothetical protein PRZ48_012740 [Zasmidium cellare]|uniref:DUF7918 domain-containing protein n=1 Tax=Zasmidium cellare TaxID=395010 RepID=A0ABR0E5P4_ZASCE|nr:hypothetical protein PRZ48_012740 [Zasmidium cellare]